MSPPPVEPVHRSSRSRVGDAPVLGLAVVALVLGALFLAWTGRGLIFYLDEWDFILYRSGSGLDTFLTPHNQHLLATLVVLYKALFATAGIEHYWPYRLAGLLSHLLCVALLFEVARRRIGALLALCVTLPILVLGSAWEMLLQPFNAQWRRSSTGNPAAL